MNKKTVKRDPRTKRATRVPDNRFTSNLTRTLKNKHPYMYYSQKLGRVISVKKHNQHYYLKKEGKWKKLPKDHELIPIGKAMKQRKGMKNELNWLETEDPVLKKIDLNSMFKEINSLYSRHDWSDKVLDDIITKLDSIETDDLQSYYPKRLGIRADLIKLKSFLDDEKEIKNSVKDIFSFKYRGATYIQIPDEKGRYSYFRMTNEKFQPTTEKAFESNWKKIHKSVLGGEKSFKEYSQHKLLHDPRNEVKSMKIIKELKKNPKIITWMIANKIPLNKEILDANKKFLFFHSEDGMKALGTRTHLKGLAKYNKDNMVRFKSLEKPLLVITPEKGFKGKPKYPDDYDAKFIINKRLVTNVPASNLQEIINIMGIKKKGKTKTSPSLNEIDQIKEKIYIMPKTRFMPIAVKWEKDLFVFQAPKRK